MVRYFLLPFFKVLFMYNLTILVTNDLINQEDSLLGQVQSPVELPIMNYDFFQQLNYQILIQKNANYLYFVPLSTFKNLVLEVQEIKTSNFTGLITEQIQLQSANNLQYGSTYEIIMTFVDSTVEEKIINIYWSLGDGNQKLVIDEFQILSDFNQIILTISQKIAAIGGNVYDRFYPDSFANSDLGITEETSDSILKELIKAQIISLDSYLMPNIDTTDPALLSILTVILSPDQKEFVKQIFSEKQSFVPISFQLEKNLVYQTNFRENLDVFIKTPSANPVTIVVEFLDSSVIFSESFITEQFQSFKIQKIDSQLTIQGLSENINAYLMDSNIYVYQILSTSETDPKNIFMKVTLSDDYNFDYTSTSSLEELEFIQFNPPLSFSKNNSIQNQLNKHYSNGEIEIESHFSFTITFENLPTKSTEPDTKFSFQFSEVDSYKDFSNVPNNSLWFSYSYEYNTLSGNAPKNMTGQKMFIMLEFSNPQESLTELFSISFITTESLFWIVIGSIIGVFGFIFLVLLIIFRQSIIDFIYHKIAFNYHHELYINNRFSLIAPFIQDEFNRALMNCQTIKSDMQSNKEDYFFQYSKNGKFFAKTMKDRLIQIVSLGNTKLQEMDIQLIMDAYDEMFDLSEVGKNVEINQNQGVQQPVNNQKSWDIHVLKPGTVLELEPLPLYLTILIMISDLVKYHHQPTKAAYKYLKQKFQNQRENKNCYWVNFFVQNKQPGLFNKWKFDSYLPKPEVKLQKIEEWLSDYEHPVNLDIISWYFISQYFGVGAMKQNRMPKGICNNKSIENIGHIKILRVESGRKCCLVPNSFIKQGIQSIYTPHWLQLDLIRNAVVLHGIPNEFERNTQLKMQIYDRDNHLIREFCFWIEFNYTYQGYLNVELDREQEDEEEKLTQQKEDGPIEVKVLNHLPKDEDQNLILINEQDQEQSYLIDQDSLVNLSFDEGPVPAPKIWNFNHINQNNLPQHHLQKTKQIESQNQDAQPSQLKGEQNQVNQQMFEATGFQNQENENQLIEDQNRPLLNNFSSGGQNQNSNHENSNQNQENNLINSQQNQLVEENKAQLDSSQPVAPKVWKFNRSKQSGSNSESNSQKPVQLQQVNPSPSHAKFQSSDIQNSFLSNGLSNIPDNQQTDQRTIPNPAPQSQIFTEPKKSDEIDQNKNQSLVFNPSNEDKKPQNPPIDTSKYNDEDNLTVQRSSNSQILPPSDTNPSQPPPKKKQLQTWKLNQQTND